MTLAGKTAIVTGASGGIGAAIARELASQGARLVLGYHLGAQRLEGVLAACQELGNGVVAVQGDLALPATVDSLVAAALELGEGSVHALVNNAAVMVDDLLGVLEDRHLDSMIQCNISALVRLTRAVLRPMMRRRSGSVVNLSSVLAGKPGPGNAVYAGTKGFVESFTRALAAEVSRKGIRVNAVAPGLISTPMSEAVSALLGEQLTSRIAMRRPGSPEEVARVVAFLCGDGAAYVTGAVLPVDGGFGLG